MGVTIGELQIKFDAETNKLDRNIKGIEKRLVRFEKTSKKATGAATKGFATMRLGLKKLQPLVGGLIATIGPIFLVAGIKGALAFGDSIEKTADKIVG